MPEDDLRHAVSFDLRWFPPSGARRMVELARARGLVREVDGGLEPTFDPESVDLPVPYEPGADALADAGDPPPEDGGDAAAASPDPAGGDGGMDDVEQDLLDALADAAGWDPKRAVREVQHEVDRLGGVVTEEVTTVLLARAHGADVSPWTDAALQRLRAGSSAGDNGA